VAGVGVLGVLTVLAVGTCAATRVGGATLELEAVLAGVTTASCVLDAGGASLGAMATVVGAVPVTLGTSPGALTAVAAVTGVLAGAPVLETRTNAAPPTTIAKTAIAIAPITIGALRRAPSSFSLGANVTGGASGGANI